LPAAGDETAFLQRLHRETEVDSGKLERVFHIEDGQPRISVQVRRLGGSMRQQARTVAQLVVVARQCGLGEVETLMTVVRTECDRLRCLETNTSKYLRDLDGILTTGPPADRRLRVRAGGVEAFRRAVDSVLGTGGE
jgi:hypothetical protein